MNQQRYLSIGQLASAGGCKVQTVRYYESIGLLPVAHRTEGNQRRFSQQHLSRLLFVRHSRELGFSLDSIRELLELSNQPDAPCDAADSIARRQLGEVESRIARLQALRDELQRMVHNCEGGEAAQCAVLEVLADHRLCAHHEH